MAYLVKRRAVLREEAPVSLGEIQGDGVAQWMMRCNGDERCVCAGNVLRIAWTREGSHGEGDATTRVQLALKQYTCMSSFDFLLPR